MSRPTGARDDDLEAFRLGALSEREQALRGAMRGDDALLAVDAKLAERLGRVPHGIPVRLASHNDGYRGGHEVNSSQESRNIGRIISSGPSAARRGKGAGMDYPVLVNHGKPLIGKPDPDEHEKEAAGARTGGCKTQPAPGGPQSRPAQATF